MPTINLPVYNISLEEVNGFWSITSDLHEPPEDDTEEATPIEAAMDGIESLILAHASNGIDVTSPAYVKGIVDAVEACMNNLT